jgi:hypothetical protein
MVRPLTDKLIQAIMLDLHPSSNAVICDFGIDSQRHYEALYYPVRDGEIDAEKLDSVLGNGPAITELVRSCQTNPHKDIVFKTAYDMFL